MRGDSGIEPVNLECPPDCAPYCKQLSTCLGALTGIGLTGSEFIIILPLSVYEVAINANYLFKDLLRVTPPYLYDRDLQFILMLRSFYINFNTVLLLVEVRGFEPRIRVCNTRVFPLHYTPIGTLDRT